MSLVAQRRLLIADDSAATRTALENLVEPYGFEVEHAENGAVAIQLLKTHPFDLVFLDLEMPVLDGTTLLRVRRQLGDMPPVVLVTSSGDTRRLAESIKLGAADYVPKPFAPEAIRRVLARVLGVDPSAVKAETPRCLVVDGDPSVAGALRSALPVHVEVDQVDAAGAEERMGRAGYRAVLVDASAGREAAEALCRRLQEGQADPAYLAMGGPADALRAHPSGPFDATLSRPPGAADVRALYPACVRPVVFFERGRVTLAPCTAAAALEPLYFRVAARRLQSASSAAARMTMRLSVDLSRAPARSSAVEALARDVARVAAEVGVRPEIVASPVLRASLERLGLPARVATPQDASRSALD